MRGRERERESRLCPTFDQSCEGGDDKGWGNLGRFDDQLDDSTVTAEARRWRRGAC